LVATLDEYVAGTELRYAWSVLRDHLEACHLYLSAQAIVIRPFMPPTSGHAPFCAANQRVYMSATLGEGGELERLTGRKDEYAALPSLRTGTGTESAAAFSSFRAVPSMKMVRKSY
jgi:hypothetical protein